MAKSKRKRKKKPYTGQNRHHLLFQARNWNTGKAKILRDSFVYMLDVKIHDELHNAVLRNIQKPSPGAVLSVFNAFCEQRCIIEHFDIIDALEWLENACDEEPFHSQMHRQTQFIKQKLKK